MHNYAFMRVFVCTVHNICVSSCEWCVVWHSNTCVHAVRRTTPGLNNYLQKPVILMISFLLFSKITSKHSVRYVHTCIGSHTTQGWIQLRGVMIRIRGGSVVEGLTLVLVYLKQGIWVVQPFRGYGVFNFV